MWGRGRFLFLWLAAGFCGSCAAVYLTKSEAPLAGASGALCGLLGALGVWVRNGIGYFRNATIMPLKDRK